MARHVGEIEIFWTNELHGWTFEHGVVLFANEACIFDGLMDDIAHIGVGANNADIILMRL